MMDNVFDGLLGNDDKGNLEPAIAESYQITDNGLACTFKLRQNVKFHNGQPLTFLDVKYSFSRLAGFNGDKPLSSKFEMVKSVDTSDDYTAVIHLKVSGSSFISRTTTAILPKDYKDQSKQPIGAITGERA